MPLYGIIELTRSVGREYNRFGGERFVQFEQHSVHYHPGIIQPFSGMFRVGCPIEFPEWRSHNHLPLYKTFEYVHTQQGLLPYEITYALLGKMLFAFKAKIIDPTNPYTLVNIPNLEKIHAEITQNVPCFDDPRLSLFMEIVSNPSRLGVHPGLITAAEAALFQAAFQRSIAYDNLSGESLEKSLAEILDASRECSAFIDGNSPGYIANLVAPLDLDPRVTFPFSRQGPDEPMRRWSPGHAPIIVTQDPPFQIIDTTTIVDDVAGRDFLHQIDRLPFTEFNILVKTDPWGSWLSISTPYLVDRYAMYRKNIWQDGISSVIREHLGSLMAMFRKHSQIEHEFSRDYNLGRTVDPSEQIRVEIERNFMDEVSIRFFRNSSPLYPCLELYYDLAMASLSTFSLVSTYGDFTGGQI